MPTNAELLADLVNPRELARQRHAPATNRRTRDFLLTAGIGTAIIVVSIVKLAGNADGLAVAKLAFTGAGLFCALVWYIFYGVMSRY